VVGQGSYSRLIDSCITQLKAQGPSRTCNESKEEEVRVDQTGVVELPAVIVEAALALRHPPARRRTTLQTVQWFRGGLVCEAHDLLGPVTRVKKALALGHLPARRERGEIHQVTSPSSEREREKRRETTGYGPFERERERVRWTWHPPARKVVALKLRAVPSCTQLKAHGPSRTCNEIKEEEETPLLAAARVTGVPRS